MDNDNTLTVWMDEEHINHMKDSLTMQQEVWVIQQLTLNLQDGLKHMSDFIKSGDTDEGR